MQTLALSDPTRRIDDMELLHPFGKEQFWKLSEDLKFQHIDKHTPTLFLPFETWRTPMRQRHLLEVSKTTKAGPFQSPHQFGLAVDFVPYENGHWSWAEHHDWEFLKARAEFFGLTQPIKWDRPHVEHPRWNWVVSDLSFR